MPSPAIDAGTVGANAARHVAYVGPRVPAKYANKLKVVHVTVDYRDDEATRLREAGQLRGPLPAGWVLGAQQQQEGAVAGGACSFDVQCDDGNPCTNDRCDIDPGGVPGSGICRNDPVLNGENGGELIDPETDFRIGSCSDNLFCNGLETCGGGDVGQCIGTCAGGANDGQICQVDAGNTACPNGLCQSTVCVGGTLDGSACTYHEECTGGGGLGTCQAGTPPTCDPGFVCDDSQDACALNCGGDDANCDDGLFCTIDVCNADGICEHSPACGLGADCLEAFCQGGGPGVNGTFCASDVDCGSGQCRGDELPAEAGFLPKCFFGRCCDSAGNPSKVNFSSCQGAGDSWYAGDAGREPEQGPAPPCPPYSAGIAAGAERTVYAGPTSLTAQNNIMAPFPIRKLGDDYSFAPTDGFTHITGLRFVGGVSNTSNGRISFEFYDRAGNFIEDAFFITEQFSFEDDHVQFVTVVTLQPGLVVPNEGYVVGHVLQSFAGTVTDPPEMWWAATNDADLGTNLTNELWVQSDPVVAGSPPGPTPNFLQVCSGGLSDGLACGSTADCEPPGTCVSVPGVLSLELEGDPVLSGDVPDGACCDSAAVDCSLELEWVCRERGDLFNGAGSQCSTCATGNIGATCRTCSGGADDGNECFGDADCTTPGTCELNNARCSMCDDGLTPCPNGDADCPGQVVGSCSIPGTCELAVECGVGGCCNPLDGTCTTGETQGSCEGTCPAGTCVGGLNDTLSCTVDADCGTFLGFGTDCDPNCCRQPMSQWTGRDHCQDAVAVKALIQVPSVGEVVYTQTGDNSMASSERKVCSGGADDGKSCFSNADCAPPGTCAGTPDSCFPPSPIPGGNLGWWEAFAIDDCAYVEIDHCCTTPVKIPALRIIYDQCPCGNTVFTKLPPFLDPLEFEGPDGRGKPVCDRDNNAWGYWGPLTAGTYMYPILSDLFGSLGEYQLHVRVQACPDAVCCTARCDVGDNAGQLCGKDGDCPGGQCLPECSLLNILECQAVGGAFLAQPNRSEPVTGCLDGSTCNTGSCCTDPGTCIDEILNVPIDVDTCDGEGGTYVGGFRCAGGTCNGGDNNGDSCRVDADCPGGSCSGSDLDLAQPSPCPVCQVIGPDTCQHFDDSVTTVMSDLSVPGGLRLADDFRPTSSPLTTVCVWGSYNEADADDPTIVTDCIDSGVQDSFVVTVYGSNPVTGLPDDTNVIGSSTVSVANTSLAKVENSAIEVLSAGDQTLWAFNLKLDNQIVMPVADGSVTYWLETANNLDTPAGNRCFWEVNIPDKAYNDLLAQGTGPEDPDGVRTEGLPSYSIGSARPADIAFCTDISFQSGAETLRPCCKCDLSCSLETKRSCDTLQAKWFPEAGPAGTCGDVTCGGEPDNNNCQVVLADCPGGGNTGCVATQGGITFDNHCTTADGPNPTPSELGDAGMTADVWYLYEAECDGLMTVATCASGNSGSGGLDTFMGVYHDSANPKTCVCPTIVDHVDLLWPNNLASDEDCDGQLNGGGGTVTGTVETGDCFMIRVGGFAGQGNEEGTGIVTIVCGTGAADPPVPAGDNTCWNGETDTGTLCESNNECGVGEECGLKNRHLSISVPIGTPPAAISVKLINSVDFPGAANLEWWVEDPIVYSEGPTGGSYTGAKLSGSCVQPALRDWTGDGAIHIWGQGIVPKAEYEVTLVTGSGASSPLTVLTSDTWADVVAPFNRGIDPDFGDIGSEVDKFKSKPGAPVKARAILCEEVPDPTINVGFEQISAAVGGFKGKTYAQTCDNGAVVGPVACTP